MSTLSPHQTLATDGLRGWYLDRTHAKYASDMGKIVILVYAACRPINFQDLQVPGNKNLTPAVNRQPGLRREDP